MLCSASFLKLDEQAAANSGPANGQVRKTQGMQSKAGAVTSSLRRSADEPVSDHSRDDVSTGPGGAYVYFTELDDVFGRL